MGVSEVIGADGDRNRFVGAQGLHEIAADFGVVLIDGRDRDSTQELAEIGLRIEQAVDDRGEDNQAEDPAVVEDTSNLGGHRASYARNSERWLSWLGLRRARGRRGDRCEPQPAEPEQGDRKRAEDHEWRDGARRRQSAHRLVKQDLDVPAQRQKGAPEAREAVHGQDWKSDAGKAKRRIANDRGHAHADREISGEKLKQPAKRKIGDDEQAGRRPHQHRVAAKGNIEEAVDDAGVGDHHQNKNRKQRRELAEKPGERAAAGGLEPCTQAAPRKFGPDRIASGDRDDDVKNGRQDGAEQELGVVLRRVGEHILLDNERPRRERAAGLRWARQRRGRRGDGVGDCG